MKVMSSCLIEGVWAITFTQSNSKEPRRPGETKKRQSLSQSQSPQALSTAFTASCVITAQTQPHKHQQKKEWELKHFVLGVEKNLLVVVDASASRSRLNILGCTNAATSSEM